MARVTAGGKTVQVPEGALLRDALPEGVRLPLPCGGQGRCGKCRVTAAGRLSPPQPRGAPAPLPGGALRRGAPGLPGPGPGGTASSPCRNRGRARSSWRRTCPPSLWTRSFAGTGQPSTWAPPPWPPSSGTGPGGFWPRPAAPTPSPPGGADVISRIQAAPGGPGKCPGPGGPAGDLPAAFGACPGGGDPPRRR